MRNEIGGFGSDFGIALPTFLSFWKTNGNPDERKEISMERSPFTLSETHLSL